MSQRVHRSVTEWQSIIDQQSTSGLSASKFCKQHQIRYASFCKWRKRLCTKPIAVDPVIDLSQLFTDGTSNGRDIELDLGNGIKLKSIRRINPVFVWSTRHTHTPRQNQSFAQFSMNSGGFRTG